MKNIKTNKSGVTLISLIVTIIVIVILSSVGVYTGINAINSAKMTAFGAELKIMQVEVNNLNQKWSNGDSVFIGNKEYIGQGTEGTEGIQNIGDPLTPEQKNILVNELNYVDEYVSGFRYYSLSLIKNGLKIEGVNQDFLVNVKKRMVVSPNPLEGTYYTIEQLPNSEGLYNVEYDENRNKGDISFDISVQLVNSKIRISVSNIEYPDNIKKGSIYYKKSTDNDWRLSNDTTIIINEPAMYSIKIIDAAGNESQIDNIKWTSAVNENTNYTDANGKTAIIPAGFALSIEDSDINKGLVIADKVSIDYRESTGSEFVWVPVDNPNEMYGTLSDGTKAGKLYTTWTATTSAPLNWTETEGVMSIPTATDYREPDTVSTYDGNSTYLGIITSILTSQASKYANIGTFKTTMQEDYKVMIDSVIKYGGFYVGRYETSLDSTTKQAKSEGGVLPTTAANTDSYRWYGLYARQKAYSKDSVQGSMIWGSQYDAMLKWMQDGNDKAKINETTNAPHNLSAVYKTGSQSNDKTNNIYDLEGNGFEWTLEAYSTNNRAIRGGYYGSAYAPSRRSSNTSNNTAANHCSRLSLYIK